MPDFFTVTLCLLAAVSWLVKFVMNADQWQVFLAPLGAAVFALVFFLALYFFARYCLKQEALN